MSAVPVAVKVFQGINLAFELISAGQLVLGKIYELQQKRLADGKELTSEDVDALMTAGDVQTAIERAQLVAAQVVWKASE